jgi:hypothetical protein
MTASSTLCCKSAPEARLGALGVRFLATLWLVLHATLAAAELQVTSATLGSGEDGYVLNAEFQVELNPRLEEVVARGVPLYIVAEFELSRPRWYWFDEVLAERSLTWRLSYHALTRQYRLSTGALHQNFPTLDDALRIVARIRDLPVAERGALKPGTPYEARLRLQLDLTQLPKPLQVSAIGNRDWSLGGDWHGWTYTPPAAAPEAK